MKFILAMIIVLSIMVSCREPIVYVNDIEYVYEVCDTISTKLKIPEIGYTTYTIRCIDGLGNERTYLITDKP